MWDYQRVVTVTVTVVIFRVWTTSCISWLATRGCGEWTWSGWSLKRCHVSFALPLQLHNFLHSSAVAPLAISAFSQKFSQSTKAKSRRRSANRWYCSPTVCSPRTLFWSASLSKQSPSLWKRCILVDLANGWALFMLSKINVTASRNCSAWENASLRTQASISLLNISCTCPRLESGTGAAAGGTTTTGSPAGIAGTSLSPAWRRRCARSMSATSSESISWLPSYSLLALRRMLTSSCSWSTWVCIRLQPSIACFAIL